MGFGAPISYDKLTELDAKGWELYHIETDFAETKNLAVEERDRLISMIGMWYAEAGKYNVLPIDSRSTLRFAEERPQIAADRKKYLYYPHTQAVPSGAAPRVLNVQHSISVEVTIPESGVEGVLLSMGGNDGGFAFYVQDGKLTYGYNYVADTHTRIVSTQPLPSGHHILSCEFEPTGAPDVKNGKGTPAKITLLVDGAPVGSGDIAVTIPLSLGLSAGVVVGADTGSPCMPDYKPPFAFTGTVHKALVDVTGESVEDQEAKMRLYLARQ
jgi:arylsulfatase